MTNLELTKEEIAWLKKTKPEIGNIEKEISDRAEQYVAMGLSSKKAKSQAKLDFSNVKIIRWGK